MKAFFKSQNLDIPCEARFICHDGDPLQEFPTGLFLVKVTVTVDRGHYQAGERYTFGAKQVFAPDFNNQSLHDLAKQGLITLGTITAG